MKLKVQKREITKKKVRNIIKEGVIPAAVYGPKRKPVNVQVSASEFGKVFEDSGYSKIIDFEVEGEKGESKVLIREVQHDPVTDEVIHVSFYDLDLTKPITTEVPVVAKGISKAVKESVGFLVTPFEYIEVRCLPEKLPDHLEVEISNLDEIGDNVSVSDLKLPDGVTLVDIDEKATLAYIAPPQKEIVEEEPVVAEGEEEEEGEEGEVAEGEEGAEGEEKEEGEEAEGEEKGEEKAEGAEEKKE